MVDRQRQTNMFGYHYPFPHEDDVNEQNRWYQHFLSTPKNAMHRVGMHFVINVLRQL